MFDTIKNIFRKRYLKRYASTVETGLVSLSKIKSSVVFVDAEDKEVEGCKASVLSYFKSKGIKASICFLDLSKKTKEEQQITSLSNTILRKDLNWCGKPSKDRCNQLAQPDADLFVSLIDNSDFTIEFMAAISPAKFKVGRHQVRGNIFDLVVENGPDQPSSQAEAFAEITRYIETIG